MYIRLVCTCLTCGMRVNAKRFGESHGGLEPKAMFTVIRKGVKGLNTEVHDVVDDEVGRAMLASIKVELANRCLDTLIELTEELPWLKTSVINQMQRRGMFSSPRSQIQVRSPSRLQSGVQTPMATGATQRSATPSRFQAQAVTERSKLSSTSPVRTRLLMPSTLQHARGRRRTTTSAVVVDRASPSGVSQDDEPPEAEPSSG